MKASRSLTVVFILLAGCGAEEPVRSVDWYKSHHAEMDERISLCERDSGNLALTRNCVNAKQARNEQQLDLRSYRKREALNLEVR